MGMLAVIELAQKVETGVMTLAEALGLHFTTGFVNPIRDGWIPVCVGIIEKYKEGDTDLSYGINVPDKPTDFTVLVESVVEDLHLEPFMAEAGE